MKVKNKAVIKKLSHRVLAAKKKKNIISVLAIVLTTVLFTAVFTIGGSMIKSTRESTMIQVGSSAHAGMERLTKEQFDIVSKDPKIHGVSYNIYAGNAVNPEFKNFPVEVRYREELNAKYTFSEPETGRMPKAKDEIAASSLVLKDLGVPCRLGETFTLEIAVNQEIIQHTFTLVGYWEGNQGMMAQCVNISRELCEEIAPTPLEPYYKNAENYSGYIDMELNFSTAWNIQKQADALMQRCGFDPNQVKCGVNWAYETDSIETADAIILAGLLLLIMLSGYLIIYNVFYLNVFNDIRFYGLLKTIGTKNREKTGVEALSVWNSGWTGAWMVCRKNLGAAHDERIGPAGGCVFGKSTDLCGSNIVYDFYSSYQLYQAMPDCIENFSGGSSEIYRTEGAQKETENKRISHLVHGCGKSGTQPEKARAGRRFSVSEPDYFKQRVYHSAGI